MQLRLEIEHPNFRFSVATDEPQIVTDVLRLAFGAQAARPEPQQTQFLWGPGDILTSAAAAEGVTIRPSGEPVPVNEAQAGKEAAGSKKAKKQAAAVQEAAAAVPQTNALPPAAEPAQAAPGPVNGHPAPPLAAQGDDRDATTDAVVAALSRNRAGLEKLLAEFGVKRFRDLDPARRADFHAKVVLL